MLGKKLRTRLAMVAMFAAAVTGTAVGVTGSPATAATGPVSNARILIPWSITAGQQPENITTIPGGDFLITLSRAAQVVEVTPAGQQRVVAQLPVPADGGVHTPVLGFDFASGIVRMPDGTLYVGYATGHADTTGIWRIRPGQAPERVIALAAGSFPNGMALDPGTGQIYFADSTAGTIWRFSSKGDSDARVWASGVALEQNGVFGLGVNGLKVHDDAVWTANSDRQTILRIPVRHDGSAGTVATWFRGLSLDDFAFISRSDVIVGAMDPDNKVAVIRPDGTYQIVLDGSDGLSGPTSIAITGGKIYVPSAGFITHKDPNLLVADINTREALRG
jgi:hypothetical protein